MSLTSVDAFHTYHIDGTFPGLMTACYHAYQTGKCPTNVALPSHTQSVLFGDSEHIETDPHSADLCVQRIKDKGGARAMRTMTYGFLSEDIELLPSLITYAVGIMTRGAAMMQYHAHPAVDYVHRVARNVGGEIHRLCGLLRFRLLEDGTYFAPCAPDYNVTLPVSLHFRARLRDQIWVVYDVERACGMMWDTHRLQPVTLDESLSASLKNDALLSDKHTEEEKVIQGIWRRYFTEISVEGRTNPRLQRQNMPARYWRYLVEKPGRTSRIS